MSHIAIDARIIASGTGRYVERLLTYLQEVDRKNDYSVIVRPKDEQYWQPTASNFHVITADFADYSFGEQIGIRPREPERGFGVFACAVEVAEAEVAVGEVGA